MGAAKAMWGVDSCEPRREQFGFAPSPCVCEPGTREKRRSTRAGTRAPRARQVCCPALDVLRTAIDSDPDRRGDDENEPRTRPSAGEVSCTVTHYDLASPGAPSAGSGRPESHNWDRPSLAATTAG